MNLNLLFIVERWRTVDENSCGVALKSLEVHECGRCGAYKRNERKKEKKRNKQQL